MLHRLKILPEYFEKVLSGEKTFEVRYNDRDFNQGDTVVLMEYNSDENSFSGKEKEMLIGYVLSDFKGLQEGWVVFSIIPKIDNNPNT